MVTRNLIKMGRLEILNRLKSWKKCLSHSALHSFTNLVFSKNKATKYCKSNSSEVLQVLYLNPCHFLKILTFKVSMIRQPLPNFSSVFSHASVSIPCLIVLGLVALRLLLEQVTKTFFFWPFSFFRTHNLKMASQVKKRPNFAYRL